jgi:hypothetical protein
MNYYDLLIILLVFVVALMTQSKLSFWKRFIVCMTLWAAHLIGFLEATK